MVYRDRSAQATRFFLHDSPLGSGRRERKKFLKKSLTAVYSVLYCFSLVATSPLIEDTGATVEGALPRRLYVGRRSSAAARGVFPLMCVFLSRLLFRRENCSVWGVLQALTIWDARDLCPRSPAEMKI